MKLKLLYGNMEAGDQGMGNHSSYFSLSEQELRSEYEQVNEKYEQKNKDYINNNDVFNITFILCNICKGLL